MDKPIFYLKFTHANTDMEVRLNDIPVLELDSSGTTSSEKPVPETIVDGENDLVVTLSPLEDEEGLSGNNSSAEASLIVREKDAALSQYETLIHLHIDAAEDESDVLAKCNEENGESPPVLVEYNNQVLAAKRSTTINPPYPRWEWQDGVSIEDTQENYNELLEQYKKIHTALSNGDMDVIKDLYSAAANEFASAYHYDDVEEGHRIINTGEFADDSDWELGSIEASIDGGLADRLDIYANGKLARIVDADGDELLIAYRRTDGELFSFQKFGFYKSKQGEWIMIR